MFTQPCFIRRNTPELRRKLKELGYRCNNGKWMGEFLATFKREDSHDLFYCGSPEYDMKNNPSLPVSIDAGTNEDLFLALAALRDDTNLYQWHVMDVPVYAEFNVGDWFLSTDLDGGKHVGCQIDPIYCHKATVEEIVEHFSQSNIKERYKNLEKTKWFQDTYENKSLGDTIEIE